jgi:hypothetical protein
VEGGLPDRGGRVQEEGGAAQGKIAALKKEVEKLKSII